MELHNLKPAKGSVKKKKRLGRGQASGSGGTAGRGHKGAKSRSGYSKKIGFEGGQMPLQRRVPKFGFTNPNKVSYKAVNVDFLQKIADEKKVTDITIDYLQSSGLVGKNDLVKVLGRGKLSAKVNVTAHKFSAAAVKAIEAAGGKANVIETNK